MLLGEVPAGQDLPMDSDRKDHRRRTIGLIYQEIILRGGSPTMRVGGGFQPTCTASGSSCALTRTS